MGRENPLKNFHDFCRCIFEWEKKEHDCGKTEQLDPRFRHKDVTRLVCLVLETSRVTLCVEKCSALKDNNNPEIWAAGTFNSEGGTFGTCLDWDAQ